MRKLAYYIATFLIFLSALTNAQSSDDFLNNVIDRIDTYFISMPRDNVFVHSDRSVYFTGENILLKVVATEASSLVPASRSNRCALSLLDARGKEVISTNLDLYNGEATGAFKIPMNLNQGSYKLIAYTMQDNILTANKVFSKDIVITDPSGQLMIDYSFDKEYYVPSDQVNLAINAYGFNSKAISKMVIDYQVISGEEVLASGSSKTDKEGSSIIGFRIPVKYSSEIIVEVNAKKGKARQQMFVRVPLANPVSAIAIPGAKQGVSIDVAELSDTRLKFSAFFSPNEFRPDKKVIIAIFRKGLLYWSAPGQLGQAKDISIPVTRIPSGIIDITVFDPEAGELLAEKMVYFERANSPSLDIKLNRDIFSRRQKVEALVSFAGNIVNVPVGTNMSVSVVPKDMLTNNELLLDEQMLIDVDIQQDIRKYLSADEVSESGSKSLQAVLDRSDRNGYSWDYILEKEPGEEKSKGKNTPLEQLDVLYFPSYFNAEKMKDYSQGIVDKRHPNTQQMNYKRQLESGMSILEVVKTIKPYTMYGTKVIFPGKLNSIYAQQGALIVVDNQPVGTDASYLNSINPTEVESINVSTNPADVQKYTAHNSVGVIEVNMKGYSPGSRIADKSSRDDLIRESFGKYLPGYPDYSIENDQRSITLDNRSLLYWQADLAPGEDDTAGFEFYTSDMKGIYVITVQGMLGAVPLAVTKEFEVK